MFRDDLSLFMVGQLGDMAKNVARKSADNIANRAHNPFSLFEGREEKYMAVGRSLDSQLGTRLQKIAFYCARYTYGFVNVPNIVVMDENTEGLTVETLSYPVENGMTQCLYWGGRAEDRLSVSCRRSLSASPERLDGKVYRFGGAEIQEKIQEIKEIIHGQGGKMPMDLFYLDPDENAHTYEIKAGGNLDTKNKVENRNEVMRLEKVFSMFGNNVSKFATCYNNRGEGSDPDGAIFGLLDGAHKVVGRHFWEEVLPLAEVSYDEFIALYADAFVKARVRDIIANGN